MATALEAHPPGHSQRSPAPAASVGSLLQRLGGLIRWRRATKSIGSPLGLSGMGQTLGQFLAAAAGQYPCPPGRWCPGKCHLVPQVVREWKTSRAASTPHESPAVVADCFQSKSWQEKSLASF